MKALIERLFTQSMWDYPWFWQGNKSEGYLSKCYNSYGQVLHSPTKGEFVLKASDDETPAFQVVYANQETRRIMVKPTNFYVQYNDVLKKHRESFPNAVFDPSDSKIFLVETNKKALCKKNID